jgi:hypothetical protein
MSQQTVKNVAYDNAVSLARLFLPLPLSAAGATATCAQYFALGNETLYAAHGIQRVAGTSTFTTTATTVVSGTSTTVVSTYTAATTAQAFRVSGTTTTTFQTFPIAAANGANGAVALHNFTACGTAASGTGGTNLVAGDQIYMVLSTDATATVLPMWEIAVTPLANVTA